MLSEMNRHLKLENHHLKIEFESLKAKVELLGAASQELSKERDINKGIQPIKIILLDLAEKNSFFKLQIETLQKQLEKKTSDYLDMETQLEYQRNGDFLIK